MIKNPVGVFLKKKERIWQHIFGVDSTRLLQSQVHHENILMGLKTHLKGANVKEIFTQLAQDVVKIRMLALNGKSYKFSKTHSIFHRRGMSGYSNNQMKYLSYDRNSP